MTRHAKSEAAAMEAAAFVRDRMRIDVGPEPLGLVLGTGWGDALSGTLEDGVAFNAIPGFADLDPLEGHARECVTRKLGGRRYVALRGRVHLNERPNDPSISAMVRLQVEMLLQLGVKKLIVTCAAGSLTPSVGVGDIVFIDGFMSLFAPDMPAFAGEFCSPEDAIDQELIGSILKTGYPGGQLKMHRGAYAMVRGPWFEGRKYDKAFLASTGACCVGMSVLPETGIASLYTGTRVLPIAFITNDAVETHSHEENVARAKAASAHLSRLLKVLVDRI